MRPIPKTACLACGEPIEETLFRLGSPRCLDCRQASRPLDPVLATQALNGHARDLLIAPYRLRQAQSPLQ